MREINFESEASIYQEVKLFVTAMAQQGLLSDQEKHCSVCFDLLKDPVAIPCGHRYCMRCIKSHCDEENQEETHSCPQCGQIFMLRCVLEETNSSDSVEQPKKTGLQAAPGPADETVAVSDTPQGRISEDQTMLSPTDAEVDEPKTRAEFLKHSCEITLDPNTVNGYLLLSDGNRKVTKMAEDQGYPSHPDRFIHGSLVLSNERLTGRHYFEVERSGGAISVGVSYKDVSRKGTESVIGFNDKSWAVDCFNSRYQVRHVSIHAAKPYTLSSRVGVYLDHRAGILSFYDVSDTMTLLHRYQTTFTEPLHVGLWVHGSESVAVVCYDASC